MSARATAQWKALPGTETTPVPPHGCKDFFKQSYALPCLENLTEHRPEAWSNPCEGRHEKDHHHTTIQAVSVASRPPTAGPHFCSNCCRYHTAAEPAIADLEHLIQKINWSVTATTTYTKSRCCCCHQSNVFTNLHCPSAFLLSAMAFLRKCLMLLTVWSSRSKCNSLLSHFKIF